MNQIGSDTDEPAYEEIAAVTIAYQALALGHPTAKDQDQPYSH